MKNYNLKQYVILLVIVALVIAIFYYFNPIGKLFGMLKGGSSSVSSCIEEMKTSGGAEVGFLFNLMGIPEDKTQVALDEYLNLSCDCFIKKAGSESIESYLSNADNKPVVDECAQKSIATVQEKHAGASVE